MSDENMIPIGTAVIVQIKYRWYDGRITRFAEHPKWKADVGMGYYEVEFRGWFGRLRKIWTYGDNIRVPQP